MSDFDLSTATPVEKAGFDLSTAKRVGEEKAQPWKRPDNWKTVAPVHTDYSNSPSDVASSYGTATGHALRSEGHGVVDPMVGIGQVVSHAVGAGDWADRQVREREQSIAAERAASGEKGTDWWRTAGNVMSPVNYMMPAGAGANALRRIGTTALSGGAANAMMPVTEGDFWTEKAKQFGTGTVVGGVLGTAGEVLAKTVVKPLTQAAQSGINAVKRWLGAEMPSSLESGAVHKVLEQFGKDEAAGGPKLTEVMDLLNTARTAGKPMTLADLGGPNVKAVAGYVTRQPGASSAIANQFLDARDAAVGQRLHTDITKYVSGGDTMKQTADALTKTRAAAARPLYEEAMKPGSVAPLKGQFESEFARLQSERAAAEKAIADADRGVTSTAAKASQAGQVGDLAMRGADAKAAAQGATEAARARLAAVDAQEAKVTEVMREAQRAEAAGERGGVWSPRVQQFLEDPIVRSGIRKGLEVQRLESLAEGKAFNPADYAVKIGADGEPVVGQVPNMRTLDAAKRGMDEILEGYRDKTTGRLVLDQRGRAIDQVRRSFVDELDRLNPSYKAARASWSGPSQSIDAMQRGRELLTMSPEEIADMMKKASPNEREFVRLGLADKLRQAVDEVRFSGDESKALIKNERSKQQIMAAFDDPKEAQKFIDGILAEGKMFGAAHDIRGNSATARRQAADRAYDSDMEAAGHGVSAAKNALVGDVFSAMRDAWRAKQALGWRKNEAMNAEVAKLLFDPALTQNALEKGAGVKLLQNFPGPATQNYLAQGVRNAFSTAAVPAAMIANQGVQQ